MGENMAITGEDGGCLCCLRPCRCWKGMCEIASLPLPRNSEFQTRDFVGVQVSGFGFGKRKATTSRLEDNISGSATSTWYLVSPSRAQWWTRGVTSPGLFRAAPSSSRHVPCVQVGAQISCAAFHVPQPSSRYIIILAVSSPRVKFAETRTVENNLNVSVACKSDPRAKLPIKIQGLRARCQRPSRPRDSDSRRMISCLVLDRSHVSIQSLEEIYQTWIF